MSLFESSLNHLRRQLDALTHDFTSALGANASRLTGFNPYPGQQQLQQHTPRTWATPRSSQRGNRALQQQQQQQQGSFFDPFFDDPFFRDSNEFLFNSRNRRGRRLQQPQQPQQLQQSSTSQQASPSAESTNQSTSSTTPQQSSTSLQSRPQSQVSEWGDTSPSSSSSSFGWLSPWSNMVDSPMEFELPEIKVDVHEEKDKYVIKAETPGIAKENVKVKVEDGYLTITGEKKEEKTEEDKDKKYRRMERSFGTMQRSFSLPQDVDVEKIEAKYDNGVLSLTLPRNEQKQEKGKEISIQ